ncbi:MAG: DUF3369 domain-containing protein, partial [Myxococcales bacterium]|nr:DUF3369 domain-containing protein [Myxococcales bacterium]
MSPPEQPEITTDLACMSSGSLDWLSDDRSSEPEFDLEGDSYWYVMIVDDDEEVHQASRFALRRFEVFGRSIRLLHARSTKEAMDLITMYDDIAVAMVDVVMETKDAGLQLVRWMRERQRGLTRIILRTGQPGDAPPLRVVRECDIDDYRTKSELDRERMLCCLTTAIRSYRELRRLDENRRGLKVIVESVAELWSQENLSLLSSGILTRIAAVLGVSPSGVVCVGPSDCEAEATGECFVISGIGRYRDVNRKLLSRIANRAVAEMRDRVGVGEVVHHGGMLAMRFCCRREQREFFVCLEVPGEVSSENLGLLQLFASNISALLHNVELLHRLDALAFEDLELGIGNRNALRLALTRVFEAT